MADGSPQKTTRADAECIVCDALCALAGEATSPSEGPFDPIVNVVLGAYLAGIHGVWR